MTGMCPTSLPVPRTEGWWKPQFEQQLIHLKGKSIGTLMIGDSLAARWPSHVVWPGGTLPQKFAIGGDRTQHILWRIMQLDLVGLDPEEVVIFAGANNITSGPTVEAVAQGIVVIVRYVRSQIPHRKVTTMAVPLRGEKFEYKREFIETVNRHVAGEMGALRSDYIDTNVAFLHATGGVNPSYLFDDEVHYSASGYVFLAGYVARARQNQPYRSFSASIRHFLSGKSHRGSTR